MKNKTKIPKIIHYCWFGGNPLPKMALKCIESWKKYCPDYEIIEWNESNFDLNLYQYAKEAYDAKKYAFVSDVCRLHALCTMGGIYMDTDVEVLKNLDKFLDDESFSGFESVSCVPTGIMGSTKGNKFFKELLSYYDDQKFINEDGTFNTTTNVVTITNYCNKYGFKPNNEFQIVNTLSLYPKTYFCPLNYDGSEPDFSENTYTIHHFSGSWLSKKERKKLHGKTFGMRIRKATKKIIGQNNYQKLKKLVKGKSN